MHEWAGLDVESRICLDIAFGQRIAIAVEALVRGNWMLFVVDEADASVPTVE